MNTPTPMGPEGDWLSKLDDALPLDGQEYLLVSQFGELRKIRNNLFLNFAPILAANYGVTFDGVTDDTDGLQDALDAGGAQGRPVLLPFGTGRTGVLTIPSNTGLFGQGLGLSTLKALDGATNGRTLLIPNTSTNITIRDLTLDGNRDALGTPAGTLYCIGIGGTHVTLEDVELRHSEGMGAFVGDSAISSAHVKFLRCWIHDNGGTINEAGFGAGIFSGGAVLPTHLTVEGCLIENNHNTVNVPGDSCGVNLTMGRGVKVINCIFKDNYNVNGGQLFVGSDGLGTDYLDAVISGNLVTRTGSFGGDHTFGIEVRGRGVSITANIVDGFSNPGSGIVLTGQAGQASIIGNFIRGGYAAITLYGFGDDPVSNVVISGNNTADILYGVELNTFNNNIVIEGNNFSSATDPFPVYGGQLGTLTTNVVLSGNVIASAFGRANERREATGGLVALTSLVHATVAEITLPKGTWEVFGVINCAKAAATKLILAAGSISQSDDALDSTLGNYYQNIYGFPGIDMGGASSISFAVPSRRFSPNTDTTYYLVTSVQFSDSSMTGSGKIVAIKVDAIK